MITGFVPSYELDTDLGKKIANLKGLEYGWNYPVFLLHYIRNPGPLLLFDEIIIDEGAAKQAAIYLTSPRAQRRGYERCVIDAAKPSTTEIKIFQELVDSKLFRKERVVELISEDDFERIKNGYFRDAGIGGPAPSEFRRSIAIMTKRYGRSYAAPTPERFEAMNINVTSVLSEKLSVVPIDDVFRIPLYEYKELQAIPQTRMIKKAITLVNQARNVLYLPTTQIKDVDDFIALHDDPRIVDFRRKVHSLSLGKATAKEISLEISEANAELRKLDMNIWVVAISLINIAGGLTRMIIGDFASGSIGTATGAVALAGELKKAFSIEKFGWLELLKGLYQA